MRSTEAQLLEAELMNSTPEHVYAWLKRRAEASNGESYNGDKELEEALLSRESGLIDLGLARYGFCEAVVRKLFSGDRCHRDGEAPILGRSGRPVPSMTQALRLAALSNCALMKHDTLLDRMPQILFGGNFLSSNLETIREFVTSSGPDEVIALFQNPTIDGEVLAALYKKEPPFDSLSEERWQHLIGASVGNPRLQTQYVGAMDGWAEYRHSRVFDAAWALAEKVPTTKGWADILVFLLQKTSPESFSIKDPMAVIQRWHVTCSAETDAEPAEGSSAEACLDGFGTVRLVLVRLLSDSEIHDLRSHEDVAMRCAFYRYGKPRPEELIEAHAREPEFLLNYALWNDAIWTQRETREALRELCWADKSGLDLWFPNCFKDRSEELQSEHPDWFREDQSEPREHTSSPEGVLNVVEAVQAQQTDMHNQMSAFFKDRSEKLQSEHPGCFRKGQSEPREHASSPEVVLNLVAAVQAQQTDMHNQVASLQTRVTIILWVACIVLALIVLRRW